MISGNQTVTTQTLTQQVKGDIGIHADEKTRESSMRFFKETVKVHGVKTSQLRNIIRKHFKAIKPLEKAQIFSVCDELWQSGYLEEAIVAAEWAYSIHKRFEPADFAIFERWLDNYVGNWAACDTLCNHTIGSFIEMYPDYLSRLKEWTQSDNLWMRRGAAVSLIVPARKGMFLNDIFEIADSLLTDKEDLVQKGYGWMLKVASQSHQKEIYSFILNRKQEMPRTALRYAIEKLPEDMRAEAMKRDGIIRRG